MRFLLLGAGKTGALVAEIACDRHHEVELVRSVENLHASALTAERLCGIDVVIDFTTPDAVMENIAACLAAGNRWRFGTTGWYDRLPEVRALVEKSGTGFIFGANFSVGVTLFLEIARTASAATQHAYTWTDIRGGIMCIKTMLPRGPRLRFRMPFAGLVGRRWRLLRFVKARSWGCMRWFSIRRMTGFIFATMRSRGGDLRKGRL